VAAGVLAPAVRRRVRAPTFALQAVAFASPVALCVAVRRSRVRDVGACVLQMWAYVCAYKQPHDDAVGQAARTHLDYPIVIDRALGLGALPTERLQRALARSDRWTTLDRVLVWTHWVWFAVPHLTLVYVLVRRPERVTRAAVMTYAVFDLGAAVYWVAPTAPPWWTADVRNHAGRQPHVRRMMVEYGEYFWRDGWGPLYSVFGGNPLAAMPSLHFATSLMAATLLTDAGPVAGALGWSYALTLGFALIYLGEHYVVDLLAGAALTAAVHRLGPSVEPALRSVAGGVARLEARAHEGG